MGHLTSNSLDCAMVTWNLNEQGERAVLDYAAEHGKAILVKKALASGHLAVGSDPVQQSLPVSSHKLPNFLVTSPFRQCRLRTFYGKSFCGQGSSQIE